VPRLKEEQVEETVSRSIDGAPPESPSDPADDLEDIPVQTKLTVGQPNDRYEQEADRVAEQVMSMPDTAVQRTVEDSEETEIQAKPIAGITRFVQRKAAGPTKAASGLEAQLNGSKGQGSGLPDDVRSFMEPRFGVDFGQVRVHTDGNAVQMNKSLGAKAFAHGSDVYYGAGNTPGNDALTAHELTHVVQQTGGGVRKASLPKSSGQGGALQPKAIANDIKRFERGGEDIQAKVLPEQAIERRTEAIGGKAVQCKTLVTATTGFFEQDGWDFQLDNPTTLRLLAQGKNEKWTCYAQVVAQHQFLFYSICPIAIPKPKRSKLAEFITRANYAMTIGNFELDYSDGKIRYKTSIDVEGDRLTPALIKRLVYTNVAMMDEYLPRIRAVVEQNVTPQVALT
jgi:hypothetical protein